MMLSILYKKVLGSLFDILTIKIISKYDHKQYPFVDIYWMQTRWLTDGVKKQIK